MKSSKQLDQFYEILVITIYVSTYNENYLIIPTFKYKLDYVKTTNNLSSLIILCWK